MAMRSRRMTIDKKNLRGSRLRCLMFTSTPREQVARCLTELVQPYAIVEAESLWKPRGFRDPADAKLDETPGLLSPDQQENVTAWWLVNRRRANTPNWDLVSTATIEDRPGLILVEAKAHLSELKLDDQSGSSDPENRERIEEAIREANAGLNTILPSWSLSRDSHYQLSNRFAWGREVAELGMPAILVYLGFLNADEMADQGQPFHSARGWADAVRTYASGIVPGDAWDARMETRGAAMRALVRAMDLRWETLACQNGGAP